MEMNLAGMHTATELLQSFHLKSLNTSRHMPFCASRCPIQHRVPDSARLDERVCKTVCLRRPAVGTLSIRLGRKVYGLNAVQPWKGFAPCHLCRYGRTVEGAEEAKAYYLVRGVVFESFEV